MNKTFPMLLLLNNNKIKFNNYNNKIKCNKYKIKLIRNNLTVYNKIKMMLLFQLKKIIKSCQIMINKKK